jgi:CheY-like chemotaxis protein
LAVVVDGNGFEPGTSEELFVPFSQQDRSLARTTAGLGLGLPIARTIVELHGGQIAAHSDGPGHGATFTIELPTTQHGPHRAASVDGREIRTMQRHRSVLPIEDHDDVATAYLALLRQFGLRTEYARTGAAGIELARRASPDVILCDIGLPDMDGHEVAEQLRAASQTAHIPLIAISGYAHPEDRTRSEQAGFSQHLVKPLSSQSLARALIDTASSGT